MDLAGVVLVIGFIGVMIWAMVKGWKRGMEFNKKIRKKFKEW